MEIAKLSSSPTSIMGNKVSLSLSLYFSLVRSETFPRKIVITNGSMESTKGPSAALKNCLRSNKRNRNLASGEKEKKGNGERGMRSLSLSARNGIKVSARNRQEYFRLQCVKRHDGSSCNGGQPLLAILSRILRP